MDFDLLRKNPVERMSGSSSSGFKRAKCCGVGYFLKMAGVTMFTRASVHCADRMVATSSSQALRCVSAHCTFGYVASRRRKISATRFGSGGVNFRAGMAKGQSNFSRPAITMDAPLRGQIEHGHEDWGPSDRIARDAADAGRRQRPAPDAARPLGRLEEAAVRGTRGHR